MQGYEQDVPGGFYTAQGKGNRQIQDGHKVHKHRLFYQIFEYIISKSCIIYPPEFPGLIATLWIPSSITRTYLGTI